MTTKEDIDFVATRLPPQLQQDILFQVAFMRLANGALLSEGLANTHGVKNKIGVAIDTAQRAAADNKVMHEKNRVLSHMVRYMSQNPDAIKEAWGIVFPKVVSGEQLQPDAVLDHLLQESRKWQDTTKRALIIK